MYHLNLHLNRNEVLSNFLVEAEQNQLLRLTDELGITNHVAIFSSGTTGGPVKGYLLSRDALLKNAAAVNERLGLSPSDVWGASLPHYHIGGLSIFYRAKLLGHSPVNLRPWNPETLTSHITHSGVTVLSLVPAQLYDLVTMGVVAPPGLKAVLLGGDFLSQELEKSAVSLGWPVVRTFGMSEVCSQLCTGEDTAGHLIPLPLHTLKVSERGQLLVKSQSLFSYLITKSGQGWILTSAEDLKQSDGFYPLPDQVILREGNLLHQGRIDQSIKSSGHLVDLRALKEILDALMLKENLWGEMELVMKPSSRHGTSLSLHVTPKVPEIVIRTFKKLIAPVKVDCRNHGSGLFRTELGKFKAQ